MDEKHPKVFSRRKFFEVAGVFTAAGVLAVCPVEAAITPTLSPASTNKPNGNPTGTDLLQTEFDLTPANAQIFWLFIANKANPLGRREIARQANISPNTLKDHITRIIRHVRSKGHAEVTTLNQAVNIAGSILAEGKQKKGPYG